MHHCCNVVTGGAGHGSGVLIRAVEPLDNREFLEARRGVSGANVTNGPGKVTQALGIDRALDGHDLHRAPLLLVQGMLHAGETVSTSPRIGISKAKEVRRRYFIAGHPYVSRSPHNNLR